MEILSEIILAVATIVIPAIFTWIGIKINELLDNKYKRDIVLEVVKYVEQTCKDKTSEEKYEEALRQASDWLASKNLTISSTELKILIESAVNGLTNQIKREE